MRVIGIDPGTIVCGYGIVEKGPRNTLAHIHSGEIKLKQKSTLQDRLKAVYDSLGSTIEEYSPDHLCLEKIFYHKSIRAAMTLGSVRGIVLLLAAEHNLPLFEYNSTELKMALTGYGRAEKGQVQEMVKIVLNLKTSHPKMSLDCSDALALCICHLNSMNNRM
ncbi:MAG TPA: crossover junction endodeoxyribonuclease RuvC [Nitrospirae bacterium]|nr:crossover junction endodeoxyribonuclease RuvC [Nitrospirota bacterium]